jgi:hypothetical protein
MSNTTSTTDLSIAFDIDETLCHTFTTPEIFYKMSKEMKDALGDRLYSFNIGDPQHPTFLWGIVRKGARELIKFCQKFFKHTGIWTAGKPIYAKEMKKILFGDTEPDFLYTWDNLYRNQKGTIIRKRLVELYNDKSLHAKGIRMTSEKTLIIDDREDVCADNINNMIQIIPYRLGPNDERMITPAHLLQDDDCLPTLQQWLVDLHQSTPTNGRSHYNKITDVKLINKNCIFQFCNRKNHPQIPQNVSPSTSFPIPLLNPSVFKINRLIDRNGTPIYENDTVSVWEPRLQVFLRNYRVLKIDKENQRILVRNPLDKVEEHVETYRVVLDLLGHEGGSDLNNFMIEVGSKVLTEDGQVLIVKGLGRSMDLEHVVIVHNEHENIFIAHYCDKLKRVDVELM